jgi:hypothetical protein
MDLGVALGITDLRDDRMGYEERFNHKQIFWVHVCLAMNVCFRAASSLLDSFNAAERSES